MPMTNLMDGKRKRTGISLVGFLALALMTLSCSAQPGRDDYLAIGRIPKENQRERLATFSSFSVDRQIDLYLFAQNFVEGSNEDYLRYLANEGDSKLEKIVGRIDTSPRFAFKTDLIRVLDLIDLNCECVRNDANIFEVLTRNLDDVPKTDATDARMSLQLYRTVLDRIKTRTTQKPGHL